MNNILVAFVVVMVVLRTGSPTSELTPSLEEAVQRKKWINDILLADFQPSYIVGGDFPQDPVYASVLTFSNNDCSDLVGVQSYLTDTCFTGTAGYSKKYMCCKFLFTFVY
jgi:hypothetical protein